MKLHTGDDFNHAELIAGDAQSHSHALLGIFGPITPVAAMAPSAHAAMNAFRQHELMGPTVELSRGIFRAPTHH